MQIIIHLADSAKSYSLCGMLDKCRTSGGHELLSELCNLPGLLILSSLEHFLHNPLCDLKEINDRLDIVEALVESATCRDSLHKEHLRKVSNITPLMRRLSQKKASLDDCYKLYRCVCALEAMIESFAEVAECSAVRELILVRNS